MSQFAFLQREWPTCFESASKAEAALRGRRVRWRAELDKIGFEHETPWSDTAALAMKEWQRSSLSLGNAPVFTADQDKSKPMPRHYQGTCGRSRKKQSTCHGNRCAAGMGFGERLRMSCGPRPFVIWWRKEPQTVVTTYQQASLDTMRRALAQRRHLG